MFTYIVTACFVVKICCMIFVYFCVTELKCSPSLSVRNGKFISKSNGTGIIVKLVCDTGYYAHSTLQAVCSVGGRRIYVRRQANCLGTSRALTIANYVNIWRCYYSCSLLFPNSTKWKIYSK